MATLITFLNQLFFPTISWALSGGPSQPETQGFQSVNSNELVNLFTGDFSYNIPLMDVGGYPINLGYAAGAGMEQEASMVGLGWSLTPGAINRTVRGLPDDFDGDEIKQERNIKAQNTLGASGTFPVEALGADLAKVAKAVGVKSLNLGVYYNNYSGWGTKWSAGNSIEMPKINGVESTISTKLSVGGDSKQGLTVNTSLSVTQKTLSKIVETGEATDNKPKSESPTTTVGLGMSFASSKGLTGFNLSGSYNEKNEILVNSGDAAGSHSFGIGYSSYMPTQQYNMRNFNAAFDVSVAVDIQSIDVQVQANTYFATQFMPKDQKETVAAAYGSMYYQQIGFDGDEKGRDQLLDFNRTSDFGYRSGAQFLNLTQTTYDVFSMSGQGTGGAFKLFRKDVPMYGDPIYENRTTDFPGLQFGLDFGPSVKVGVNGGLASFSTRNGAWTGKWENRMALKNDVNFDGADLRFEKQYFRKAGEMTPIDEGRKTILQDYSPSRPVLGYDGKSEDDGGGGIAMLYPQLMNRGKPKTGLIVESIAAVSDYMRAPRSTFIQHLTNEEATSYGLNKEIYAYEGIIDTAGDYTQPEYSPYARSKFYLGKKAWAKKAHHIGAFYVTEASGTRYIYDIPTYNFKQVEVSFAVNPPNYDTKYEYFKDLRPTGLVEYSATDASKENEKGVSNYYSRKEVPAHAQSYLLTGILSPDYVDVTGNGISHDDLGTYVKFNYQKHSENYKWRAPLGKDSARYNPALFSKNDDDMASYAYGEKELWYIHSIESKTHVAEFGYSPRTDAVGVSAENGELSTDASGEMLKLDRIDLYNKIDRYKNIGDATPIKVVHFDYDYTLCQNLPNSKGASGQKGKLTLSKVSFSYGESEKARLSPYKFTYNDFNPNYNMQSADRWGTYKPDDVEKPNSLFPYTIENQALADQYAGAWNLSKISLPSGGEINVTYEADDYAFVMDKRAHHMVDILGVGDTTKYYGSKKGVLYNGTKENYYLYFDISQFGLSYSTDKEVKDAFWPDNGHLHYKSMIYIKRESEPELFKDFVHAADMGIVDNNHNLGWIRMKAQKLDLGTRMNPISYNSWDFILSRLNEKVFESSAVPGPDGVTSGLLKQIATSINKIAGFVAGKYRQLRLGGFAQNLELDNAMMRLAHPTGYKKGGGHRVKKVEMKDHWDDVSAQPESGIFGVVYEYLAADDLYGTNEARPISSGVAAYEPGVGNEENPHVQPIYSTEFKIPELSDNKWAQKYYKDFVSQENLDIGPIGEAFYPSPIVGYRRVKVQSLANQKSDVDGTPTGYTVNEFYSAKEFPIHILQTDLKPDHKKTSPVAEAVAGFSKQWTLASQGFSVFTNDMHGKMKSVASYKQPEKGFAFFDRAEDKISGTEYLYKTKSINDIIENPILSSHNKMIEAETGLAPHNNWLDNKVRVLNKDGSISEKEIGVDLDACIDTRAMNSHSYAASGSSNMDLLIIMGIPIPIPTLYFGNKENYDRFRSASMTKLIQQRGVLEKVIAYDEQSKVETRNVMWDATTGNVLLTKTTNEYQDAITNFTYPAHYAYDALSPAVENQGIEFKKVSINVGKYTLASSLGDADQFFKVGDELALSNTEIVYLKDSEYPDIDTEASHYETQKAWVKGLTGNKVYIIDESGYPVNGVFIKMKIIRSGGKNILGTSVGSYSTMENLVLDTTLSNMPTPLRVTQASASTFSDKWETYADQIRVKKCVLGPQGVTFQKILNAVVADSMGSLSFSSINGFSGSKLRNFFKSLDYYLLPQPGSCETVKVGKTFYTYKFVFRGNSFFYSMPWETKYTDPTVFHGIVNPGAPSIDSFLYWEIVKTSTDSVDSIFNCTPPFDTIVYDYPLLSGGGNHHLTFGLGFEEAMGNSDPFCKPTLTATTEDTIYWENIDSFTNMRINTLYDDGDHFLIDAYVDGEVIVLSGFTGGCFKVGRCYYECKQEVGQIVNPFITGTRGIWRAKDQYAYHADRDIAGFSAETDYNTHTQTRLDGTFNYEAPWTFGPEGLSFDPAGQWISPATLEKVSPAGNHIESIDALGRPSAEVFGYDRKLVKAVGQNAYHHDLAYDGFEEYDYPFYYECQKDFHWALVDDTFRYHQPKVLIDMPGRTPDGLLVKQFSNDSAATLSSAYAHTGRASLFINTGEYIATTDELFNTDTTTLNRKALEPFRVGYGDFIQNFAPEKGRKYIISGWVREQYPTGGNNKSTYENVWLKVAVEGTSFKDSFEAYGPIIEGWQRISGVFTIPTDSQAYALTVTAKTDVFGGLGCYFDDIRIQPYNSSMVTYVYDPLTLRLTAELDENNFATFYEYDQEGRLLRIKKETERGIVTLQESRYGIPKTH